MFMSALTELMEGFFVGLYFHINLKNCSNKNGKEREDHVVESDWPAEPKRLAWSHSVEAICELYWSEDHIFVEEVKNHLCDSDVVQPSVIEQQFP